MADYAARTQDGFLYKTGGTYSAAQGATPAVQASGTSASVGQDNGFDIYRVALSFDTSATPAGSEVQSAVLSYYVVVDHSDTDFNINLYYGTQPTFGGTLDSSDWGKGTVGPTLMRSTTGLAINTKYTVTLPNSSINCGGFTEYEIRSSREGTTPTGMEYVDLGTAENTTYKPYLTVTYILSSGDNQDDQDGACVVLIYV